MKKSLKKTLFGLFIIIPSIFLVFFYMTYNKALSFEEGAFIARSANRGISAFINPNGRVLKSLNTRESGNIELNFPYFKRSTVFSNYGNKIFFLIIFLYIFLTLIFKKFKI